MDQGASREVGGGKGAERHAAGKRMCNQTPDHKSQLDAGALAPSGETTQQGAGSRRIPSRLQPWKCSECTFENPGTAAQCKMCEKGAKGEAIYHEPSGEECTWSPLAICLSDWHVVSLLDQ